MSGIPYNKAQALRDETEIGFKCVRHGLQKLEELRGMHTDYYITFLLLGNGLERILKVLICFDEFDKKQKFPGSDELRRQFNHGLTKLNDRVVKICEEYPLYSQASARIEEINFIKNNTDFNKVIKMISDFLESSRYYNLNIVTEDKKQKEPKSPHEILMDFRSDYSTRNPNIQEMAWLADMTPFYTHIHSYLIELLQRYIRFLALCFTQGAFGSSARQYSVSLLNPFLDLTDNNLSKIKF